MGQVVDILEHNNNGLLMSSEQMLEMVLKDIRSGKLPHKKALLVLLDDQGCGYNITRCQAGMRANDLLSVIEITKSLIKREMGY